MLVLTVQIGWSICWLLGSFVLVLVLMDLYFDDFVNHFLAHDRVVNEPILYPGNTLLIRRMPDDFQLLAEHINELGDVSFIGTEASRQLHGFDVQDIVVLLPVLHVQYHILEMNRILVSLDHDVQISALDFAYFKFDSKLSLHIICLLPLPISAPLYCHLHPFLHHDGGSSFVVVSPFSLSFDSSSSLLLLQFCLLAFFFLFLFVVS